MVMAMPTCDLAVWLRGVQPAQALPPGKIRWALHFDAHSRHCQRVAVVSGSDGAVWGLGLGSSFSFSWSSPAGIDSQE